MGRQASAEHRAYRQHNCAVCRHAEDRYFVRHTQARRRVDGLGVTENLDGPSATIVRLVALRAERQAVAAVEALAKYSAELASGAIVIDMMVTRVAGGVVRGQPPRPEHHLVPILKGVDAIGRYRDDLAEQPLPQAMGRDGVGLVRHGDQGAAVGRGPLERGLDDA